MIRQRSTDLEVIKLGPQLSLSFISSILVFQKQRARPINRRLEKDPVQGRREDKQLDNLSPFPSLKHPQTATYSQHQAAVLVGSTPYTNPVGLQRQPAPLQLPSKAATARPKASFQGPHPIFHLPSRESLTNKASNVMI
jgi:hypothetical protein